MIELIWLANGFLIWQEIIWPERKETGTGKCLAILIPCLLLWPAAAVCSAGEVYEDWTLRKEDALDASD